MREDWTECCFEDILDYEQPTKYIVNSTDYKDSYEMPVLTAGKSFIKGYTNETDGIFENLPTIIFDDFTTASQYVDFKFKVKSSAMKILVPTSKLVNMKFAFYGMQVNQIRNDTHKRYWISVYAKKKFLLPSLAEQKAIISKIEELFSDLDKGIADLKKAKDQLVVYRQAVLKKAFEGRLTHSDQDYNSNSSKVQLPISWKWTSIFDFLIDDKKGMATGPFGTALKKHEHKQEGIPVLGIENIGEGVFVMPNKIFVTAEKAEELKSFKVIADDIIISRSGTVGEICSLPKKMESSLISTNLIRVRLNLNKISPKFFVYLFQGGNVREQVKELCKGSTRVFLNQTILKSLKLPYCSIEEQNNVVKEIESRLSVCDKVEQSIIESLEKAKVLRHSILKKAFEGTLLSAAEIARCKQEQDYESASVLLAKIKAKKKKTKTVVNG